MSIFSRKPKPCDVCHMRGYHDHNVHRVHARQLAREIKNLRIDLDDEKPSVELQALIPTLEKQLVTTKTNLHDQAAILGLSDAQVEEMIVTA